MPARAPFSIRPVGDDSTMMSSGGDAIPSSRTSSSIVSDDGFLAGWPGSPANSWGLADAMNHSYSKGVDAALSALRAGEAMPSASGRFGHTPGKAGREKVFISADLVEKKPMLVADSQREAVAACPLLESAFSLGVSAALGLARSMPTYEVSAYFGAPRDPPSVPSIRRSRSSF